MCGIVGIATSRRDLQPRLLETMRDALRHRGPDDEGLWIASDGLVAMAHRRLAILDLSPAGHQPMADAADRLHLVFNGEIYNHAALRRELERIGHRFRSRTDTEVILEAYLEWGTDCVTRFNGMFAFALYDADKQCLFLARDRAGEKPLYYAHSGNRFVFASELKALMVDPDFSRRLDLRALEFYLAFGYVPGEACMIQGVRKLLPAQMLTFDVEGNALFLRTYWTLPEPGAQKDSSSDELCDELESLLQDAVRQQLEADVPVGILLSGGIDSSLVTAMAARSSTRAVKTFTVTFPTEAGLDEGPDASRVASHFGTFHTELAVEPPPIGLLQELARQYDEPLGDSSMIPTYMISKLIRRHATVALGGDGGDELFGGYRHYGWLLGQERWRRRLPATARALLGTVASRILPVGVRGRNYLMSLAGGIEHAIANVNIFWDVQARRRLLVPLPDPGSTGICPESFRQALCYGRELPGRAMEADFHSYLPDDILVKVDRASMLASLEVRAPWLDYRIVEFAFGRIPDRLRATRAEQKILPRRLAERLLPPGLSRKAKQGFSLPLKQWFRAEWGGFTEEVLNQASPDLFRREAIGGLLAGQRDGYSNNTERLFALTLFELWRREYRVGLP